jgi:hypothetical protein
VGSQGVYRYCGVQKGVSSENRGFFYYKYVLGGGLIKGFWEIFTNI